MPPPITTGFVASSAGSTRSHATAGLQVMRDVCLQYSYVIIASSGRVAAAAAAAGRHTRRAGAFMTLWWRHLIRQRPRTSSVWSVIGQSSSIISDRSVLASSAAAAAAAAAVSLNNRSLISFINRGRRRWLPGRRLTKAGGGSPTVRWGYERFYDILGGISSPSLRTPWVVPLKRCHRPWRQLLPEISDIR